MVSLMHPQNYIFEAAMLCVEQPESDPAPTGEPLPYDHEAHATAFHNAAIDAIKTHGINKITKPHPIFRTHLEDLSLKHDPLGHHAEKAHRASMDISKGITRIPLKASPLIWKNMVGGTGVWIIIEKTLTRQYKTLIGVRPALGSETALRVRSRRGSPLRWITMHPHPHHRCPLVSLSNQPMG